MVCIGHYKKIKKYKMFRQMDDGWMDGWIKLDTQIDSEKINLKENHC